MLIGYARVSTRDQNLDTQVTQLKQAGCERIFSEKVSGVAKQRPVWDELMATAKEGDVIVVYAMDRVSRSMVGLVNMIDDLSSRGIGFRSLQEAALDTSSDTGDLLTAVFGWLAKMERKRSRQRCKDGIERAKERGVRFGRPGRLTPEQKAHARQMSDDGKSQREIARLFGTSATTVNRALQEA